MRCFVAVLVLSQVLFTLSVDLAHKSHDEVMHDLLGIAKEAFQMADMNRNGIMEKQEFMKLIDSSINGLCFWNEEQVMRLRWAMDQNKDNKVDLREFLTFDDWVYRVINMKSMGKRISIERLTRRGNGEEAPFFAYLDSNKDGFVDENEINTKNFIAAFL